MHLDLQFNQNVFQSLLKNRIEDQLFQNPSLGSFLAGIQELPFFGSIADLIAGRVVLEPGVIDHIRVSRVYPVSSSVLGIPGRNIEINVPPTFPFFFFPIIGEPLPRTITGIPPLGFEVILNVHLVRVSDLERANGLATSPDAMTVISLRVRLELPQPSTIFNSISIGFNITNITIGVGSFFINTDNILSVLSDNESSQIAFLRNQNPGILDTVPDNLVLTLYQLVARLNAPELVGALSSQRIELDFSGISNSLTNLRNDESFLFLNNAGIRIFGSTVHLRVDFMVLPTEFATTEEQNTIIRNWISFYTSDLPNRIGELDWGVFFPETLLKSLVEPTLEIEHERLIITQNPRIQWIVNNPVPAIPCNPESIGQLRIQLFVTLIGACVPTGLNIDATINIDTSFTLASSSVLRLDSIVNIDTDDADMALCTFINSSITAGIGSLLGSLLSLNWVGALVGGLVGGIAGGISTLVAMNQNFLPDSLSTMQRVPGTENQYFMLVPFEGIQEGPLGALFLSSVNSCNDGMLLAGQINFADNQLPLLGNPYSTNEDFIWDVFNCTSDHLILSKQLVWPIEVIANGENPLPFRFWTTIYFSGNTRNNFYLYYSSRITAQNDAMLTVSLNQMSARFLYNDMVVDGQSSIDVKVLMQSNIGSRIVSFSFPLDLISETSVQFASDRKAAICNALGRFDDFRRQPREWRSLFGPRPGNIRSIPSKRFRIIDSLITRASNSYTLSIAPSRSNNKKIQNIKFNVKNNEIFGINLFRSNSKNETNWVMQIKTEDTKIENKKSEIILFRSNLFEIKSWIPMPKDQILGLNLSQHLKNDLFLTTWTKEELIIYRIHSSGFISRVVAKKVTGISGVRMFKDEIHWWGKKGAGAFNLIKLAWIQHSKETIDEVYSNHQGLWLKNGSTWMNPKNPEKKPSAPYPYHSPNPNLLANTVNEEGRMIPAIVAKKWMAFLDMPSNEILIGYLIGTDDYPENLKTEKQ